MRNISICEQSKKRFAFKVLLWAIEEGIFEELLKNKEEVSTRSDSKSNFEVRYKIKSIGPISIVGVFNEQASDEDLSSGNIKRYFNEDVDLKEYFDGENQNYFYLSNQWDDKEDSSNLSLPKLIIEINKIINPEFTCGYTNIEIEGSVNYLFYVTPLSAVTSKISDVVFEQIAVQELDGIQSEKLEIKAKGSIVRKQDPNNISTKFEKHEFSNQELRNNFMWRLKTQDRRKYPNSNLSFYVRLFNNLDIDFTAWCNNQIDNIEYYTEDFEVIKTNEIDKFIIDNGHVYVMMGMLKKELIFKYEDSFYFFESFISRMRYVSLDHVVSMDKILFDLKNELPALKEISSLIFNRFGNVTKLNKKMSDEIQSELSLELIGKLKQELQLIGGKVQLVLLPRGLNSAKGNRF